MRHGRWRRVITVSLLAWMATARGQAQQGEWIPVEVRPGDVSMEDGLIRIAPEERGLLGGWLRSGREYRDFVLRLEFRMERPTAMSGVYLRASADPGMRGWPARGYQVQVREFGSDDSAATPQPLTASVMTQGATQPPATMARFDERAVREGQHRQGEWNTLEVEAVGARVTVRLNDVLVSEGAVGTAPGFVGLQVERGGVTFRNVTLRPLGE